MTNEQFELKYNLYYKYLLCLAYNYTFSVIDSEDIVQEVFFKYYKRNKEFKDEMHEKNWLIRVTINQCIDFLRKKKNNKLIISVDYINKLPNTSDGEKKDGELIAYVNMLNYKYRTVIILFYYDNYSIKEISNILNISENSVKVRLNRARAKLKELVGDENDY